MSDNHKIKAIDYFRKRFSGIEGAEKILESISQFENANFVDTDLETSLVLGLIVDRRRFSVQIKDAGNHGIEKKSKKYFDFFPEKDWDGISVYAVTVVTEWEEECLQTVTSMIYDWLISCLEYSDIEEKWGGRK